MIDWTLMIIISMQNRAALSDVENNELFCQILLQGLKIKHCKLLPGSNSLYVKHQHTTVNQALESDYLAVPIYLAPE